MKKLLLIGALAATALIQASQPSEAYFRGTWCAKLDIGGGVSQRALRFSEFRDLPRLRQRATPVVLRAESVARRQLGRHRQPDGTPLQPHLSLNAAITAARYLTPSTNWPNLAAMAAIRPLPIAQRVAAVRRFNRFYTQHLGVLQDGWLDSPFSLTEARVLYEIQQRDRATATDIARALGPRRRLSQPHPAPLSQDSA